MTCVMNYTVHCKDVKSGDVGCFLFDTAHWQKTGEFLAVSPVFPNLVAFYKYDAAHGNLRAKIPIHGTMSNKEI